MDCGGSAAWLRMKTALLSSEQALASLIMTIRLDLKSAGWREGVLAAIGAGVVKLWLRMRSATKLLPLEIMTPSINEMATYHTNIMITDSVEVYSEVYLNYGRRGWRACYSGY